jgi:predicted nucleic acid-binding protein
VSAVVDASVLVAARIDSQREGSWARSAISQTPLATPELALAEATNTLRLLELSGTVSQRDATAAQRDLLRLNLRFYRFAPFAGRVWELRANLTAYDAWYVALAEALQWPLYTLDRRLSRAPGPRCEVIVPPVT